MVKSAKTALDGWKRLGTLIRATRIEQGFANADRFAAQCGVALRVVSDLETGKRTNYKLETLAKVESVLGWPSGTAVQVVSNERFTPPKKAGPSNLLFRQVHQDRNPYLVEVDDAERLITMLLEIAGRSGTPGKRPPGAKTMDLAATALPLCLPYLTRMVEDNCLPGKTLNPAVRPHYEAILTLLDTFAPTDGTGDYVRWLAGDLPNTPKHIADLYSKRHIAAHRGPVPRRVGRRQRSADSDIGD
ncbi:helix-turn-helix domain-containing protein [Mycolicibacterium austroafricanum]|uniref:helix-turn-helix domain-containing protein n=1 Tax=Mycolicibacterium austroafricanum TaxID=39687 RepID=UPI000A49B982|nr:helix-turn-helix transcriptional regulator [Mycolicibacterium austroafricanum]